MNSLIAFFASRRLFGNLITIFTIIMGLVALSLIRRDAFPRVTFDILTVTTIYPGASAEEVEKLITNPIEQDLKEVDGIKKIQSVSAEGRSYIILTLDPDQTTEAQGKSDAQDVVDRFAIPEGAEDPVVTSLDTKLTPIIEVTLSGEVPELELRELARRVEKEIEKISDVARVVPAGMRKVEIRVEADPAKLASYRLSLDELVQALRAQNVAIPGGTLEPKQEGTVLEATDLERIVRTVGEFKSLEDVQNTVVRANDLGVPIRVRDVAKVSNALERTTVLALPDGKPGLTMTVLKKEKGDAIRVVEQVKESMAVFVPKLDPRLQIGYINDFSEYVSRRINVLSGNLLVGLFLVLGLLTLLLPARVAVLVSLAIPFAFLGTIFVMYNLDVSINLISLLGLIIVVGMLVDDAIVVMDNCVRKIDSGEDPEKAAIEGTQEVWAPVLASVLTTVLAFAPMMFMSGIFGKFVWQIPLGVIVALLISLLECYFILPGHIASFVRARAAAGSEQSQKQSALKRKLAALSHYWEVRVVPAYQRLVRGLIRRRYWVALGAFLFFLASLGVAGGFMRFVLFPPDGIEVFSIKMDAQTGTGIARMRDLIRTAEAQVRALPKEELANFITRVGIQQAEPDDPNTKRGGEFAQIDVFLTPETSRARTVQDVIDALRPAIGQPPGIERITFERPNSGPPVGKPVSLSVRADRYEEILPVVAELKELLKTINGVTDVLDSYDLGKEELVVRVKASEASAAGLSVAQVGQTVRAAFDGLVATSIQGLDEEIDVRVSLDEGARASASTLNEILVPNSRGGLIPLSRVATVGKSQGLSVFTHEANQREIKVSADVDVTKSSAIQANNAVREKLPEISKKYPNVVVAFGGEDEDTQESFASLGRAFGVAILLIFLVLVFTFGNLLQPLLVMLTIPMGIISVIWTLALHGRPLSFMAMLGVIALAGVIVNNAIVLIDFVNQKRREGLSAVESIVSSSGMRLRPIFLTTATTVAGLLPTAYGIGGLDQFVVPIAMSLGWGLMFGSILTAVVFPPAIAILDDVQAKFGRYLRFLE